MKGEMLDLCLWFPEEKFLVISDFHIGFEESLNQRGVMITRTQYGKTISRLEKIFKKIKPEAIIINGDLKHEFGKISEQEWKEVVSLVEFLESKCARIILIKGNHDNIVGPLTFRMELEVVDKFEFDDCCITHGNKIVKTDKHTIIIGHEHPCATISDNISSEKTKCFLKGKYKNKELVIMPSFNLITEGTDVLREHLISPYLKQNISDFDIYVPIEEDILHFGKIKNLE